MRACRKRNHPKSPRQPRASREHIQRAISDVRRDLFDSEEEFSEEDPNLGPTLTLTFPHQAIFRQEPLNPRETAAKIGARSAASKPPTSRNATGRSPRGARSRPPVNSLIEEDLEFERAGKPCLHHGEVSEEIEQLIKRRIIAREFDEVVRRRPDAIGSASETRRGELRLTTRSRHRPCGGI